MSNLQTTLVTYCTFNSTEYFDNLMSTCTTRNITIPLQAFFDLPHHSESYRYTGSAVHSSATENKNIFISFKIIRKKLIPDTSTEQVSDDAVDFLFFVRT